MVFRVLGFGFWVSKVIFGIAIFSIPVGILVEAVRGAATCFALGDHVPKWGGCRK